MVKELSYDSTLRAVSYLAAGTEIPGKFITDSSPAQNGPLGWRTLNVKKLTKSSTNPYNLYGESCEKDPYTFVLIGLSGGLFIETHTADELGR